MLYEADHWPIKKSHDQKKKVTEIKMMRWMCEHTKRHKIKKGDIQDKAQVASMLDKMRE